ncbi:MAG: hypothetical protein DCC73_04275 [Proteobacteria bacterium]|nr:MAG: hypothetical protein DCC73_04275 [Pseudomonadota bacterium]
MTGAGRTSASPADWKPLPKPPPIMMSAAMPLKPPADASSFLNRLRRGRLLPLAMIACSGLLVVKISAIVSQAVTSAPLLIADAVAAEQAAEVSPAAGEPAKTEAADNKTEAAAPAADDANAPASPEFLSRSEMDLLQDLSDRRQKLEARSQELDTRERLLMATEQRIDRKIERLKSLESNIKALVKTHDEQAEAQLQNLVKIYEAMKPKDAARILEKLDLAVLLDVIERMKQKKVAEVLAQMNQATATEVTTELALRRQLPFNGDNS